MSRFQVLVAALTVAAFTVATIDDAHAGSSTVAEIPVQVGVGPTGNIFAGPTFEDDAVGWGGNLAGDQPVHTGLRLSVTAVIDADIIDDHPRLVPRNYRGMLRRAGEVRISPMVLGLIPSSLYLSPPIAEASAWGATWSIIGAGITLMNEPVRFSVNGRVITTLMYLNSPSASSPYFFARPGASIVLDLEVPVTDDFLISFGWSSKVHVPPQPLAGGVMEAGEFNEQSLWHFGQFYVQGHYRFPFRYDYGRQ